MLISRVKGFEGPCKPTWINRNQLHHRLDGGLKYLVKENVLSIFQDGLLIKVI